MKTDARAREALIAAATSAYRARDASGRVLDDPAWRDLDADGRRDAFEATITLRALEAAADPQGLSTTARAVLDRLKRA
jgi:hypothetical protein